MIGLQMLVRLLDIVDVKGGMRASRMLLRTLYDWVANAGMEV